MIKLLTIGVLGFICWSCVKSGADEHDHLIQCLAEGKTERVCNLEYMAQAVAALNESKKALNAELSTLRKSFQ
jgi:hypothetical protein